MLEMKTTFNGRQPLMENDLQWKTTSNERQPPMELEYGWMRMTSNGRWPQNIKIRIYHLSLIRPSSNLKIKVRGPNQSECCLKWNWPPMEDHIKILKVEYFSNHWSDLLLYCHTRPGGKTYPIPKGSNDGPKRGIIFITDPASQPDRLTSKME